MEESINQHIHENVNMNYIEQILNIDPSSRSRENILSLMKSLREEFQFFASLHQHNIDLSESTAFMSFQRTAAVISLVKEGEFVNKENIYVLIGGYAGVYKTKYEYKYPEENENDENEVGLQNSSTLQNSPNQGSAIDNRSNLGAGSRLSKKSFYEGDDQVFLMDLPVGSVIGLQSHCYGTNSSVTIKTNEQTKLIAIKLDESMGVKEKLLNYITKQKMDPLYKFYREFKCMNSANMNQDKYNSLVEMSKIKTVEPNTILFSQGDKADYMFFVLSGNISIIKNIDVIKDRPGSELEPSLKYEDPTEQDYRNGNVTQLQLQTIKISIGKGCGDQSLNVDNPKYAFSAMTLSPAKLILIKRSNFKNIIGYRDTQYYIDKQTYIPADEELRRQYFGSINWSSFRSNYLEQSIKHYRK